MLRINLLRVTAHKIALLSSCPVTSTSLGQNRRLHTIPRTLVKVCGLDGCMIELEKEDQSLSSQRHRHPALSLEPPLEVK